METRRFFTFITTALLFTFIWMAVGPKLFPGLFPAPRPRNQQNNIAAENANDGPAADAPAVEAIDPAELPEFASQSVTLGSLDEATGYRMQVVLTSAGAAIDSIALNGKKYRQADDRKKPLKLVGNVGDPPAKTFALLSEEVDATLKAAGQSLASVDWEVVQGSVTESSASFRYPIPGGLELVKTYRIEKSEEPTAAKGFIVAVELTAKNTTEAPLPLQYAWQGPVGAPLENLDSARTFIELKGGYLENPANPDDVSLTETYTARTVIDQLQQQAQFGAKPEDAKPWRADLRWAGVDVQYFASLVMAAEGKATLDFIEQARPAIVKTRPRKGGFFGGGPDNSHGDVSLLFETKPVTVAAGGEVTHSLRGFFGPKRLDTLKEIDAEGTIAFGWFGWISRGLLKILGFFHDTIGLPYAIAIMLLTCFVRLCLMPVTLKAAGSAKKMKELQPKIEELKTKFGDDKEALGRAQMELMMKEGNPLGGCLPLFLQMPIFIGLYQGLSNAVDLRMARFLWVDNLAAPDHLAQMPFTLPLLGSWFNLLPLIVVGLFLAQQKLFMPPAVSDEQKAQYKVMNVMMVVMGFMFYSVMAGLCLYFITSSLWGITERKAIDKGWIKLPDKKKRDPNGPKKDGPIRRRLREKFEELQAQADAARAAQQGQLGPASPKPGKQKSSQPRRDFSKSNKSGKNKKKRR